MPPITLLVVSPPAERQLAMLEKLPADTHMVAGEDVEAFRAAAGEADVILCGMRTSAALLREVFLIAPRVRWVHHLAAGVENALFPELIASPAPLTNSRGVFARSLAEFTVAAILYFAKDLRRMVRQQAEARWETFDVEEIHGKTLGIIGYGEIGHAAAGRARALGMKVLAVRRHPERSAGDGLADEVCPIEQRRHVLEMSDYLLVATPLTPDTRGLIGEAEISFLKPTAVIINLGRGPAVDEEALVWALESGRIRGAALDVFNEEPLAPGHPFWRMENVLLSPHCADHTESWQEDAMRLFLENFDRFRRGEPLKNVVDKRGGY